MYPPPHMYLASFSAELSGQGPRLGLSVEHLAVQLRFQTLLVLARQPQLPLNFPQLDLYVIHHCIPPL